MNHLVLIFVAPETYRFDRCDLLRVVGANVNESASDEKPSEDRYQVSIDTQDKKLMKLINKTDLTPNLVMMSFSSLSTASSRTPNAQEVKVGRHLLGLWKDCTNGLPKQSALISELNSRGVKPNTSICRDSMTL